MLKHGNRAAFRNNLTPISHPKYGPSKHRDAYLQFDHLDRAVVGSVTAHLVGRHRWETKNHGEVELRERWDIEAYETPGSPCWLFDLTATQQATDAPLGLILYR